MLSLPNILLNVANGVRKVLSNTSVNINGRNQTVNNTPSAMQGAPAENATPKPEIIRGIPNMALIGGAAAIGIYLLTMKKSRR
jgi:hypothetical protein